LCRILSQVTGPGRIRHSGIEPYVAWGELTGGDSPRTRRLLEAFSRAPGLRAELLPDIRLGMWRKFLLITGWGAVAAASGAPVGVIRSDPELRRQLLEALREIVAVARATEVALDENDVRDALVVIDMAPAEGTTSMQRDLAAGRPAEVDAQIGAVVRLARAAGVAVPYHAGVLQGLQPGMPAPAS
jgi:2-dehydropantoate 2-reductase